MLTIQLTMYLFGGAAADLRLNRDVTSQPQRELCLISMETIFMDFFSL